MNKNIVIILLLYLSLISIVASILAVSDKRKAIKGKRRIPERTLMTVGFLGGATAELITMKLIRHKTKHKKFMIGLPAEILLHIIIITLMVLKVAYI